MLQLASVISRINLYRKLYRRIQVLIYKQKNKETVFNDDKSGQVYTIERSVIL